LNDQELSIATVSDLHQHLEQVRQQQFSEIWLITDDAGPSLTILVNGIHAWLMYLYNQEDASGSISRNPYYSGSTEATMQFFLSNGQREEYPIAWTLPLEDAFKACEYFLLNQGDRSSTIVWHE
jgi:hypothetical protein